MGRQRAVQINVWWILVPMMVDMVQGDVAGTAVMEPCGRGYDGRLEGCDQKCYTTFNAWKMMHVLGYPQGIVNIVHCTTESM